MYKILIADEISQAGLQILKNHPEFEVVEKTKITSEELKEEIKNYNALVVRSRTKVTEEIINNAGNLKLIVRGGVGIDNIDKSAAEKKGIAVKNTPKASSISVAELAFGMMLSGVRRLVDATLSMKEGKWEKKKFEGFELAGKTLGILGYGNIGRSLAERAIAFCMNVLVYDPYVKEINIKGVTLTDLNTLLTSSDIISIHCPKTNETCNLINKETLAKMKDGVGIVNCARGGIVDEAALYEGLNSGKISFVGLDVYEKEPPAPDNPLFKCERVILTPHIGAQTFEGQERVSVEVANVIKEFFLGKE